MLEREAAGLPSVPLHWRTCGSSRLLRRFDAVVCLSSSIAHMQTVGDLGRAVETMARPLRPGGVLILEPWDFPENARDEMPWVTEAAELGRAVVLMETTRLHGRHFI